MSNIERLRFVTFIARLMRFRASHRSSSLCLCNTSLCCSQPLPYIATPRRDMQCYAFAISEQRKRILSHQQGYSEFGSNTAKNTKCDAVMCLSFSFLCDSLPCRCYTLLCHHILSMPLLNMDAGSPKSLQAIIGPRWQTPLRRGSRKRSAPFPNFSTGRCHGVSRNSAIP